jgi:sucrose phosphorylase
MPQSFTALLTRLYGAALAPRVTRELEARLDHWRPAMPAAVRAETRLSQRDALLITYADQMREPDRAPLRTLHDFAARHLTGVVSGIHLLPFYPWSSDDGFAVKDYFAVDPACGAWEDVARLGGRFDLMFDAVFNHLSMQSDWFRRFLAGDPEYRDFFVTVAGAPDLSQVVRPRALPLLTEFPTAAGPRRVWTTFSADQADLNFKNPAVLLRVTDALLFYVSRGARFLRLDAIAFLWKAIGTPCQHLPQTHAVIQLWRAALDAVAPGVRLITETNVPHADNVAYFGDGTNEAHLVYNFALPPLVLHSFAAGNAERLAGWARSLTPPADHVAFFNFLASHDGIGLNPARGILSDAEMDALVARTLAHGGFISYKHQPDGSRVPYEMNINYLDALANPAAGEPDERAARRFLTAHAILLCLPGVPGIYFHSLFGSRGDRAGAEASGLPRRINRQKIERRRLEAKLADPASLRARVFGGLRELLRRRAASPAFAPPAPAEVLVLDPRVFAVRRHSLDGRERALCLHNVSAQPVRVAPAGGGPEVVLEPHGFRWLVGF